MMSPEAYERLREKVKGPEDLEKELKRGEQMAELSFELQTDEKLRERLRAQADKDMREFGVERVIDAVPISAESKKALEQGKFMLAVASHPTTHQDQVVAVPEGNVQEKIPLKASFSDRYVTQFLQKKI
jgi:formiminotetrahydrofolate cyclodeaminase